MSLVRRLKQKGVLCGTEYIDKQCDDLTRLTDDDALHKYQHSSSLFSVVSFLFPLLFPLFSLLSPLSFLFSLLSSLFSFLSSHFSLLASLFSLLSTLTSLFSLLSPSLPPAEIRLWLSVVDIDGTLFRHLRQSLHVAFLAERFYR